MELLQSYIGDVPIIRVTGEVDHETARDLRESIDAAFAQGSPYLLLGLESCTYLDSGGVSALLDALRRVRPRGWLGLVAPTTQVHRILTIVGITIDPHIRVFMGLDEARMALEPDEPVTEDVA